MKIRQLISLLSVQDPEAEVSVVLCKDEDSIDEFDINEIDDNDGKVYIKLSEETW